MARDRTARTRIRQYLTSSGAVSDPSGYATSVLKDLIDYDGSPVAFIQLIAAMERDGEIVRDIRGKRTYGISASAATIESQPLAAPVNPLAGVDVVAGVQIDYDLLARAIVRELLLTTAASTTTAVKHAPAEIEVGSVEIGSEALRGHRDEYARRLDEARSKLDSLLSEAAQLSAEYSA